MWDIIFCVTAQPPPYGSENQPQQPQGPYGQPGAPYPGQPTPYTPAPAGYPGSYGVDQFGRPLSDKSRMAAGLLGIFLGNFGVGRFYLGYTTLGVLQLLFGWLTCGIWPLIDGIMILTGSVPDAQGRTLRD